MSMKPGWISFDGGAQTLLDHLRKHLGQPQLTEMSEYMSKYFKMTKRRRQEGMNDYITRKAEIYARACQTLDRAQRRFSPGVGQRLTGSAPRSDYSSTHTEQPPTNQVYTPEETYYDVPDEEQEASASLENWPSWSHSWWQSSGDWHHQEWQGQTHSWHSTSHGPSYSYDHSWQTEAPDLLPSFVQGWFLLQGAGLEVHERNLVMTALKNDFSVERVSQELRNQFPDHDIKILIVALQLWLPKNGQKMRLWPPLT